MQWHQLKPYISGLRSQFLQPALLIAFSDGSSGVHVGLAWQLEQK